MARAVLDASALLALFRKEPGADAVAAYAGDALVSTVNLQETVKRLMQLGVPVNVIGDMVGALHITIRSHSEEEAYKAAELAQATASYGGGIGDRSCMALAILEQLPVVTADREWKKLKIDGLMVEFI